MNILLLMWHAIRPTAVDRADVAITRAANLMAETEREKIKANYYTCMLLDVDPNTDWWLFAKLKQKQHDAQLDYTHNQARANVANARAEELVAHIKPEPEQDHATTIPLTTVDAPHDIGVVPGSIRIRGASGIDRGAFTLDHA